MKKKPLKTYSVSFDQIACQSVTVKARTESEAKKKAWAKFKPAKKWFRMWVELPYTFYI